MKLETCHSKEWYVNLNEIYRCVNVYFSPLRLFSQPKKFQSRFKILILSLKLTVTRNCFRANQLNLYNYILILAYLIGTLAVLWNFPKLLYPRCNDAETSSPFGYVFRLTFSGQKPCSQKHSSAQVSVVKFSTAHLNVSIHNWSHPPSICPTP